MTFITSLLGGGWHWLAALAAVIAALGASYFGGKKVGAVKEKAKADVASAQKRRRALMTLHASNRRTVRRPSVWRLTTVTLMTLLLATSCSSRNTTNPEPVAITDSACVLFSLFTPTVTMPKDRYSHRSRYQHP
ncbi:hypothetical protein O3W44_08910 [Pantoea sp. LMR881]|nr:hypothetical protein [Pantoea sp. LMR881]MCZ4059172.1 hypothetical protein [Pantoea sp. LMR881]